MPPPVRERYNAKARHSTAGSKKKGKRPHAVDTAKEGDSNTLIHVPKSEEVRELERKERLKLELMQQADSKWTSKKRKRLDKYIDKKLQKEERVQILEKLSQSQAQLSSTLHLQSSATLGTGNVKTHIQRQDKIEDKEVRRILDGVNGSRKRPRRGATSFEVVDANESEEDSTDDSLEGPSIPNPPKIVVGGALQRNSDGTVVAPKIRQRTKKTTFASWKRKAQTKPATESDTSFDSSDSDNDLASENDNEENEGEDDEVSEAEEESSEGDSDSNGSDNVSEEEEAPKPKRSLGFKAWAQQQLGQSKGYDEPRAEPDSTPIPPPAKKQKRVHEGPVEMRGPLGEDFVLPSTLFSQNMQQDRKTGHIKFVSVKRPIEVAEARVMLPIIAEEQPIMEAILLNPVVIICGETGSGKTTQVPQFLYEAGFGNVGSENPGMIGITQPRRVAAVAMASRVAHELSLTSSKVSYQIRYDATVSPSTSIKFMTDGVLLRELASDLLLTKYSVIIIDEAHERSMNTDILIGVLSRVIKLREEMWKNKQDNIKPLRLIIMSATLRVSDFAENLSLFSSPPPVINVAARQHPVTVHFNRRTSPDYVTEAIKKASKIHTRLPAGGILIFLTGQNEIVGTCRKLEDRFGRKALDQRKRQRGKLQQSLQASAAAAFDTPIVASAQADVEAEDMDLGSNGPEDMAMDVDSNDVAEDIEALDTDDEDEDDLDRQLGVNMDDVEAPMHIIPLYSLLASDKQMLVFKPPPEGSRLVVVATNVAETSLTIPGIRYVIDCGRAKERRYDISNGIQAFQISWVSKASAAQRAGRAGRTGPGHCYRLYSSALFEHYFPQFALPEILRMPIEGVVLQMKAMHIDTVTNFPFPTPPDRSTLHKAERTLSRLGALSDGKITALGRTMSLFPLSPRFSRMLVSGQQQNCLPYVIAIVAVLSVGDPFFHEDGLRGKNDEEREVEEGEEALGHLTSDAVRQKEERRIRRKAFFESQALHSSLGKSVSDIFRLLSVVGAYEYAGGGHQFCADHFVRLKAMEEVHKLRAQINSIVQSNFPGIESGFDAKLPPPNEKQLKILRQLLTAAFIDQVAVRKDKVQNTSISGVQFASTNGIPYRALGIQEDVFIHPSSLLASQSPPEYVVFTEIIRTSKPWMKGVTVINPAWLSSLGKNSDLCTFSKPAKNSSGIMMVIPHFGTDGWELPPIPAPE